MVCGGCVVGARPERGCAGRQADGAEVLEPQADRLEQIFKDPMTTMAAIDRLVHHAIILEFEGAGQRAKKTAGECGTNPPPCSPKTRQPRPPWLRSAAGSASWKKRPSRDRFDPSPHAGELPASGHPDRAPELLRHRRHSKSLARNPSRPRSRLPTRRRPPRHAPALCPRPTPAPSR